MFQLRITVIHALGKFSGCLQLKEGDATEENVRDLSDGMQATINRLERLVLTQNDGTEVAFNQKILSEAVFVFAVEEVE